MPPPSTRLLDAKHKRRFFDHLEAFLEARTNVRREEGGGALVEEVAAAENVGLQRNDVVSDEMGGDDDGASRGSLEQEGVVQLVQEVDEMEQERGGKAARKRQLPNTLQATKTTKKSKMPAAKRAEEEEARKKMPPLHHKRVLVVPIGLDMSRRRVEILQEMVLALGGQLVELTNLKTTSSTKAAKRSLLHLRGAPKTQEAQKKIESESLKVDVTVVSQLVQLSPLEEFYRQHGVDDSTKAMTPEWLTRVRQLNAIPADSKDWEWRQQAEMTSHETDPSQHDEDEDERDDESENEDGSDMQKTSTREIVRAPPVVVDTEKIQREEAELQRKKEELVKARLPIFHKLNPNFTSISEGHKGSKHAGSDKFICQKSSLMQANLNSHLTDPLEELMEFLHVERDVWREYSYKKIVSSLKAMRSRVSSVRDLKGLWWAKGRMRDKVVEILETGKLEKLEAKKTNPRLRSLVEMSRIWGVGPATAAKLYNIGYKSLDDLRQRGTEVLSSQQQIGLRYYDDILARMPRSEAQEIEKVVTDEVHRILPGATAFACGSYRRGKATCGDVDVLITDPDSDECDILPELLRRLHDSGFLTDDLTHISDHHRMGRCDSYMGVCQVSKEHLHRRIDIKVYPNRLFGFALLYFTGSDHFNRSMRLFARKKGWSLSDRYLKRVVRPQKGVKIESGESVICPTEIDVFIALGLEYKDPTERNCFDIRFIEEDEETAKRGGKNADQDDILQD